MIDHAEARRPELFDVVRRLTNYALDAEDRFSVLMTGTDAVLGRYEIWRSSPSTPAWAMPTR